MTRDQKVTPQSNVPLNFESKLHKQYAAAQKSMNPINNLSVFQSFLEPLLCPLCRCIVDILHWRRSPASLNAILQIRVARIVARVCVILVDIISII